jgi:hypothetical protein
VKKDFRIVRAADRIAFRVEAVLDLVEVVDLAVVDQDVALVLQRLGAALVEADDGETRMRHLHRRIGPEPDLVRTALAEAAKLPMVERLIDARGNENSAHEKGTNVRRS